MNARKSEATGARANAPLRLKIPTIKLDAAVESVAKTATGQMDVPKDVKNVAWYNLGPRPGEPGNAVISGHYDDPKGPTVFYTLGKLKVGDPVIVTNGDGVDLTFAVIGKESYPVDQAPLNRIFGFDLERDLNLITCSGRWNPKVHSYNQRLVIYTRLVQ